MTEIVPASITTTIAPSSSTSVVLNQAKKLISLTRSSDGQLRDRYSSYFPDYGDEPPLDLKSVLSREFASYNLSAFPDPYSESGSNFQESPDQTFNYNIGSDDSTHDGSFSEPKGNDILSNDEQRLALPLVGLVPASNGGPLDPAKIQEGADTINIVLSPTFGVEDESTGDITIIPQSEMSRLRANISDLTGLDVDRLVEEVSAVVGKIDAPLRVEEQHTQILRHEGARPKFKYTETTAQVVPSDDPHDPFIKVLSKKIEDGEIGGELGELISSGSSGNVASRRDSMTPSATNGDDVKVNVTTKTNIVNIFTFNIILSNSTAKNFSIDRTSPFKTNIETTATVDAGPNQSTLSVYKYSANEEGKDKSKGPGDPNTPELDKWLKILLKHQVSGKRGEGSLIQEAILKDASLLQLPGGLPSRPFYRKVDDKEDDSKPDSSEASAVTTEKNDIGPLGYTLAPTSANQSSGTLDGIVKFVESMGVGAIPTIFAGAIATYPFWMPLLAGGRRRRRREAPAKVDIPENWLSYLLGTRFGHNAKMSKRSTTATTPTTTTTTMSTFEVPLFTTTTNLHLVDSTLEPAETARTFLGKNFYPTTATTLTTVSQGGNSFQISKIKLAGPPIPPPTLSTFPSTTPESSSTTTTSFVAKPILKTQSLMDKWAELLKKQTPRTTPLAATTDKATAATPTMKPFSLSDFAIETNKNGVTLPENWKPSLQPYYNPLSSGSQDLKPVFLGATQLDFEPIHSGENEEPNFKPVVIGTDVSVSSSTVTEINFEPGKNAPIYTGVKSTDVPPNVWLTAEDIVTSLDQSDFDNQTEILAPSGGSQAQVQFDDGDESKNEIKSHIVSLGGDREAQIDLVVLKKPESPEDNFDSIPIIIPGLPLPNKSGWKRNPTAVSSKKPPSQSKLFIQSFLKEYNKTGEGDYSKPTLRPSSTASPSNQGSTVATFFGDDVKDEFGADTVNFFAKPVTLATFATGPNLNPVASRPKDTTFLPKEVVVNSQTIETHLTPEVANTILRTQTTDLANNNLKEEKVTLVSSSTSVYFTTPSYQDSGNEDSSSPGFTFGSNMPQDIDPSDVLKLAYGGSFATLVSDEDREREKAIDRLIQQLEREYNNTLARKSSAADRDTGGKSQLTNFRQETTGKWVYLSGTDRAQSQTQAENQVINFPGLALTASSGEILDLIKTMEREVMENNQTVNSDRKEDLEVVEPDRGEDDDKEIGLPEREIIYLNDETLKLFLDEPTEKNVAEVEAEVDLVTKMDDNILITDDEDKNAKPSELENEALNEDRVSTFIDSLEAATTTPPPTTLTALANIDDFDSSTEVENNTPPFPQGPLFLRADLTGSASASSTTTSTTEASATTTTPAPTAIEILTNVLSQSAAPLAGLSAASLAYGAAAMLPLWLPLALGKKRRKRAIVKKDNPNEYLLLKRLQNLNKPN